MKTNKTFAKRVLWLFKPFWGAFAVTIAILLIIMAFGALSPYLFGKSVDAIIAGDSNRTFMLLGIGLGIAIFQRVILWWVKESIELKYLDDHIEKKFSVDSIHKMFSFSIGQHINEHSGVKQSVVNKGQNALSGMMFNMLYNILPVSLQIIATLVILAIFDWKVALVVLFFLTIYITVSLKRNKIIFPKIEEMRKKDQSQSKLQSELYRNSTLVIAEAQEVSTAKDFSTSWGGVVHYKMTTWLDYLKVFYAHKVFIIIGQYTALTLGVYFILIGKHSTGMFITMFSWINVIFDNLGQLMGAQRKMLFELVEIRKYFELLDIAPDIEPNIGGTTISNLRGTIEFKNVSFAYPYRKSKKEEEDEIDIDKEQDHTVKNISFTIPAGAKVGFVGVSGSGKSTIVNLMRRYYEATEGEITIDGVDLKQIDLRWLRSQIGNVEQKIELFDRTIRENILFGLPGADVDEVQLKKAVTDASLDEFIDKLKDHGLDTMIGEGGVKVSGGERQRIGIARALIKDPKILIFDEATSALDSINEKLIHDAINKSAEGRTTIIIAHRLSTVTDADIIFVVKEGKIVDQGTHKELEKRSEEYQRLIKNQVLMA